VFAPLGAYPNDCDKPRDYSTFSEHLPNCIPQLHSLINRVRSVAESKWAIHVTANMPSVAKMLCGDKLWKWLAINK